MSGLRSECQGFLQGCRYGQSKNEEGANRSDRGRFCRSDRDSGVPCGLGVPEAYPITSPTFTLVNEYPGRLALYHVDLYRLDRPLDVDEIGLCDMMHGDGVVVIEWADRILELLPPERLDIDLEIVDDDSRRLSFIGYGSDANNLLSRIENLDEEQP